VPPGGPCGPEPRVVVDDPVGPKMTCLFVNGHDNTQLSLLPPPPPPPLLLLLLLDTCYRASYMSQTRGQQHFTTSEVAADWHEPMVPQRIMWLSIDRANGKLDPRRS